MRSILVCILLVSAVAQAKDLGTYSDWNSMNDRFSQSEQSFKLVMQKLLDKYIDKKLTEDDLYRAATAGMLAALNPKDRDWNKLLSPGEMTEIQEDLSGEVTGIGVSLKFDQASGHATVLEVISGTPALRAGIKTGDVILTVGGHKFKGRAFTDMVTAMRGQKGEPVELRILRDDDILKMTIKRDKIAWSPVEFHRLDARTALIRLNYFNEHTPQLMEKAIRQVNDGKFPHLIVDLRDNYGGGFEQTLQVASLLVPKGKVVARTVNRDGEEKSYSSDRGLLDDDVKIVVLTDKGTYCGAELLAAALREARGAKLVGEPTSGKWNAQTIEQLPNHFAFKYTVQDFESPDGHSYQDVGMKPDLEIPLAKEPSATWTDVAQRLDQDAQLRAAHVLIQRL